MVVGMGIWERLTPPLNPNEPNDGFVGNVSPNDDFSCGVLTNVVNDSINCQR